MKLLVLGGNRFLGRHIVDAALARDGDVTIFTRGRQPNHWGSRVTSLVGDRDHAKPPGLSALGPGPWDAVIDTSGYVPRVVRTSAQLLSDRVGRYLFVSSISVYADTRRAGVDELAPVGMLEEPATEEIGKHYGPLKAACEAVVSDIYGARALNVRPGLIVGPHDPTDRFGYWVARFVHPHLLGRRDSRAVVPNPPGKRLQFIDARDLAAWMLDLIVAGADGTFNATSPAGQWTFGALVDALRLEGGARSPQPEWFDETKLLEAKVTSWTGMPLWIPSEFADKAGFMEIDCSRAGRAGLSMRPLAAIIHDTAQWLAQRDNEGAWKDVLSADAERDILAGVP